MERIGWDGEEQSGVEPGRKERMGRPRRGDTGVVISLRWTVMLEQHGLRGGHTLWTMLEPSERFWKPPTETAAECTA